MSLTPYPNLRFRLTPQTALRMRFLPAVPGSNAAANAAAAQAAALAAQQASAIVAISQIGVVLDGGGAVLGTGPKFDMPIGFKATLTGVEMLADVSGSAVVDIWKDTYANFPPTIADTITGATPPTISAALKMQDFVLTGWNKALLSGDTLRFNVNSVTSIKRLTITLFMVKALT